MANSHNQKQLDLYLEMNKDLRMFNQSYHSIYDEKKDQFRKINNFYNLEFVDFDEHHVPFDNSNDGTINTRTNITRKWINSNSH